MNAAFLRVWSRHFRFALQFQRTRHLRFTINSHERTIFAVFMIQDRDICILQYIFTNAAFALCNKSSWTQHFLRFFIIQDRHVCALQYILKIAAFALCNKSSWTQHFCAFLWLRIATFALCSKFSENAAFALCNKSSWTQHFCAFFSPQARGFCALQYNFRERGICPLQ